MKRCQIFSTISGLSFCLLLLNGIFAPSAQAGRPVFNQTPQTINRYFGGYKTRLITPNEVIYTYAPTQLKRLFPKFPKSNFTITFVKNKAKNITLNFNGGDNSYRGGNNYNQATAAKFYNYIFGYQPPVWKELSWHVLTEGLRDYEYCLGDGVSTYFWVGGADQATFDASLHYDSRCEPPYKQ